jgi:hypothetical protein
MLLQTLLHTIYLVDCPATDNFKGALPTLADTKNKVGRSRGKIGKASKKRRQGALYYRTKENG